MLLDVIDNWTENLDEGGCIDVAYCDFMKAFDKVCNKQYRPNVFKMD